MKPRPTGSHAQVVERHHEILRQQYHKVKAQCLREGLRVDSESILDESVLAKNALVSVHGAVPYAALFGRVPNLLLDFEPLHRASLDDAEGGSSSRHVVRLREISVDTMVAGTARDRLDRALASRTRPAGELLELKGGDQVDIYRDPATKDQSGWRGPATVLSTDRLHEGVVDVRWQSRLMPCNVRDIRRALAFLALLAAVRDRGEYPQQGPLAFLQDFVASMAKTMMLIGFIKCAATGRWIQALDNHKHKRLMSAVLHVAACSLHLPGVVAARLGQGVSVLAAQTSYTWNCCWWWHPSRPAESWFYETAGVPRISLATIMGPRWIEMAFVQFLGVAVEECEAARHAFPQVPNLGGPAQPPEHYAPPTPGSASATKGSNSIPSTPEQRGLGRLRDDDEYDEDERANIYISTIVRGAR